MCNLHGFWLGAKRESFFDSNYTAQGKAIKLRKYSIINTQLKKAWVFSSNIEHLVLNIEYYFFGTMQINLTTLLRKG
jgi:hypothetical protein